MKSNKLLLTLCLVGILSFSFSSCKYNAGDRIPGTTSAKVDSVSYALGVWFGGSIASADFGELNYCKIKEGVTDKLNGKDLNIPEEEIMQIIQNSLMQRQQYKSEKNIEDSKAFLEKNKTKEGVVETESGLQYMIVSEGEGDYPTMIDTVEVNYKGSLIDGTVFDSSYDRGESATFPMNAVISGWSEGLTHAKEGSKLEIYIPANLGYGTQTYGPIPGNSTLVFEVELIKVYKGVEPEPETTSAKAPKKAPKK